MNLRLSATTDHPDLNSGTPVAQLRSEQVSTLQFDLRAKDIFSLHGRICEFERRLDGKLQFLRVEDKNPIFLTDQQLALLSASGDATMVAGSFKFGRLRGLLPSRIRLTAKQVSEADRKLDYVNACTRGFVDGDGQPQTPYEFRRSKGALDPIIEKLACLRQEKAPHFTTVLGWFDRWMTLGDIHGKACLVSSHTRKGNRRNRFGHVGEVALERGIWRWLSPNMSTEIAYAKVVSSVVAYKRVLRRHLSPKELNQIGTPSLRTFQRRCADIDKYTRDYYRKGPQYASIMYRTYQVQSLPARPYQDVEVDHCTIDIILVDDDSDLVLGRADLIVFRCRRTGMIIGYSLGYEAPSFASFIAGLRHAMYPKDMSKFPAVQMPWPCFGRIENLWFDNALHFLGKDIEGAGRELKINKVRLKPKSPWLKGALERFFGYLNTGLIHLLPGTTLSNTVEKRDYDQEILEGARIRKSDFEAMLVYFICEVHNAHKSKTLGLLRGVGDIPLRVWNEEAARHPSGPLPPADLFIALCGEWEFRTIQNDGIVWDYIKYESPELIKLITNPRHRNAREHGAGTRYKCTRDPTDLGRIYVIDPYDRDGRIITVPATRAHRHYAENRHRHNHDIAIANARRMVEGELDFDALLYALDRLGDLAASARAKPERKKYRRGLARFLDNERKARFRSEIRPGPTERSVAPVGHLDPFAIARPEEDVRPYEQGNSTQTPGSSRLGASASRQRTGLKSISAQPKAARVANGSVAGRLRRGETPRPAAPLRPDSASAGATATGSVQGLREDDFDDLADLRKAKNWSTSDE
ncbi:hypothetical protein [Methylobacterium fujisawaense]